MKTKSDYTVRKTGDNYGLYFRGALVESGIFVTRKTAIKYKQIAENERRAKKTPVTMETPITDVIFRKWPNGDILALFPGDPGTNSAYTCSCYERMGQHGSADPGSCIARTKLAVPEEYAALKRELESAPYHYRLRVVKRLRHSHLETRRAEVHANVH